MVVKRKKAPNTGKKDGRSKRRRTPGSMLDAAKSVVGGAGYKEVADTFSGNVTPDDVRFWANDYKSLGEEMFMAKYKGRDQKKRAVEEGVADLSQLETIIKNNLVNLRAKEINLTQDLEIVRLEMKKLEALKEAYQNA